MEVGVLVVIVCLWGLPGAGWSAVFCCQLWLTSPHLHLPFLC